MAPGPRRRRGSRGWQPAGAASWVGNAQPGAEVRLAINIAVASTTAAEARCPLAEEPGVVGAWWEIGRSEPRSIQYGVAVVFPRKI